MPKEEFDAFTDSMIAVSTGFYKEDEKAAFVALIRDLSNLSEKDQQVCFAQIGYRVITLGMKRLETESSPS